MIKVQRAKPWELLSVHCGYFWKAAGALGKLWICILWSHSTFPRICKQRMALEMWQGSHLSDIKRLAKQTKFSSTHCSNIKRKLYSTNAYLEHRGGTTGSFTSCSFSSPMMNSSWFLHKYSSNSREFCCIVSAQPVVFWRMQVYLHTYRYSACIYSSLCHFGMVLSLAYMEI